MHDIEILPRPNTVGVIDPVIQRNAPVGPPQAPTALLNFAGVGQGFTGPQGTFSVNSVPPDTNGDVGPNNYVQIVNTDFAIFDKTGKAIYGPVPINTLWSGFGGLCQSDDDGDPVAIYDPIADRWVISQFAVSGANGTSIPFLQCVAVSQTADPTGSYFRYSFAYSNFDDYPKMGVWPDAYYETFNFFNAAGTIFQGGEVCAFDRSKMLAGLAATQQCFNVGTNYGGLLPSDLDGSTQPPAGSPDYILALGVSNNDLAFWKFHVDWTTPANTTLTGPSTIIVAAYSAACGGGTCIPQAGTTQKLDSLADRLMFRLAYRNFGTHESLVATHSVTANSGTGMRWYEIRSPGTTPTVFQQGTFAPDNNFRWMGSIAMDQSGDMMLGYSLSSASLHPEIAITGRLASDPLGQMTQGETIISAGGGSQLPITCSSGPCGQRWGDYSMMSVDPSDDCTFFYTNQTIPSNGDFNWQTRIASFKLSGCGTPTNDFSISANPTSLTLAQNTGSSSTISTTLVSGSAESITLSVSGVPSGASATPNPNPIMTGNSSTLTVNAGTAAPGVYPLTVTGTAPSATHSTSVTLTVTQPPAITSANNTTFNYGSFGSFTVTTTGSPTPSIMESGSLPAGVNFVDNGNGTGTLSGTPTASGTFPIMFTAQNGVTPNATQSFTLTVNPPPVPSVSSINPTGGAQGGSVPVTLMGTGFIAGATVNLSGTGITVNSVVVSSSTKITATFVIAGNAPLGAQTVTVTTAGGTTPTGVSFTVVIPNPPTFTAMNPHRGGEGQMLSVTLTGTNFVAGQTSLNFSPANITASNINVTSGTQLTATFTIANNGTTSVKVSVTTPGGTSGVQYFDVYAAPTLTMLNPNNGNPSTSPTVTFTGTNFRTPMSVNYGGTGVTISNISVTSSTKMTATFTIGASATSGAVTVSNPGGTSGGVAFTINGSGSAPTLISISPSSSQPGQIVNPVTLMGTNLTGATINALNGISVSNVVASASQVTATFTIQANAPTGPQNVTVTTTNGTSNAEVFTVDQAPAITSANNATFTTGSTGSFTVMTTGFPTPAITESGALPSPVTFVDNHNGTATLSGMPASGTGGTYNITITAANGVTPNATQSFSLTVDQAPAFTSANSATFTVGSFGSFTPTASGFPAPTITESGTLPNGVNFTGGVLSGTPASGTAGMYNISFTAANGVTPNAVQSFTLTVNSGGGNPPTLTGMNPHRGAPGQMLTVTLTGTSFVTGQTTINFSSTAIQAGNVNVTSSTSLTATFTIAANGSGSVKVSVTTPNGTSGVQYFDIYQPPTLTSVSPNNGTRGNNVSVTLTGTNFRAPMSVQFGGAGVTVTNIVVVSSTKITASFNISAGAATGPQNVTVSNPGGTSTAVTFTVN